MVLLADERWLGLDRPVANAARSRAIAGAERGGKMRAVGKARLEGDHGDRHRAVVDQEACVSQARIEDEALRGLLQLLAEQARELPTG